MTEKRAVEVDAKIRFRQKWQKSPKTDFFKMHFLTLSKKVGPDLKPDSDSFLSEVSKTGLKKLSTMTNN